MSSIVGIFVLFAAVFGIYGLQGGSLEIIVEALPSELGIILGAGIASMIIGYETHTLKDVALGIKKIFIGPKWQKQDFVDAIVLSSRLLRTLRTKGPLAVEQDIEKPESSTIFIAYPRLLADRRVTYLIADTIRLMVASPSALNPYAVEDLMDVRIKEGQKEAAHAAHALMTLAGALPALGIVACVLGIVKTMASIDQPPAILGALIGSALLGTFLGVFLAYGIFEPMAKRLDKILKDEEQIYHVIKQIIVATLHGHPQPLVIEAARVSINERNQPSFDDVFDSIRDKA